ncbi:MAG: hypothetical protein JW716_04775 [Candidatus Aenigmarchaeota archaeon]|nr:hypothetical protein [Candidatus Aenigmarchaeota archaeon]
MADIADPLKKMLMSKSFSTDRSRIRMFGKMDWTLEPSRGMAELIQIPGEKMTQEELFRFGYDNGKIIVDEIKGILLGTEKSITQKAINDLLEFIGMGQIDFIRSETSEDGHHHIVAHMINNPIIEHAKEMYGEISVICTFLRGLFSAHAEMVLGLKNVHLNELKCQCKNQAKDFCEWESKW